MAPQTAVSVQYRGHVYYSYDSCTAKTAGTFAGFRATVWSVEKMAARVMVYTIYILAFLLFQLPFCCVLLTVTCIFIMFSFVIFFTYHFGITSPTCGQASHSFFTFHDEEEAEEESKKVSKETLKRV